MAKEKKLTVKQHRFADYYIELGNGTEAAIKAGYSPKSARFAASQNLDIPHVKAYIQERMAEKDSARIASQDEVLENLTRIARGEARGTALVGLGMGEQAVRQVPPSVAESMKAWELLGKRYALFTENHKMSGSVGVVMVDDTGELIE